MKKFFKFGKSKKDGSGSASASTESLAATGYLVKEKDLSKLHKAAWTGDLGKVKQLAKKDPSALDKENRTPLHLACARGYSAIVQELIEWKAKVNLGDNDARTPLIKAVECGHEDCARIVLEAKADPNTVDKNGDAAMHYAARHGSVPTTKLLLGPDITDIDLRNKEGQTPLHIAVTQKYDKLADMLLEEGADPNVQDADGRTALMHTCQDGSPELTRLLLSFQADTQLKDVKGWTADDIAIMANHDVCRQLLSQVSARSPGSSGPPAAGSDGSPVKVGANVSAPGAVGGIFGGPAMDEGEISIADESQSKISEAAGGPDSWGDTDEDSETIDPKRKKSQRGSTSKSKAPIEEDIAEADEDIKEEEKVPNLDLRHLRDDSWDDQVSARSTTPRYTSKIPRLNNAAAAPSNLKRSDSSTSAGKSHIPVAKKDSGGTHPPVSARSSMSVRSALSFGNVDSNWSDDESLFSSSQDPKKKKAPVLRTKAEVKADPSSDWSDDESAVDVGVKGKNINAIPSTPRAAGVAQDSGAEDGVGAPLASSTARSNKEDKGKTEAEIAKEKHKQMLAELGLSDVSDVSDPDFDDDSVPLSSHASLKQSGKPPPGPKRQSSTGDDWETDTPRSTAKPKVPLSARSTGSNWDSSIAEEDGDNQPVKPNLAALARGKQVSQDEDDNSKWDSDTETGPNVGYMPSQQQAATTGPKAPASGNNGDVKESLSQWDTDPVEASHASHTKEIKLDGAAPANTSHQSQASARKASGAKREDSLWDSDVEDELAPATTPAAPPLPASPPPQKAPDVNLDKTDAKEAKDKSDDVDWDSEEEDRNELTLREELEQSIQQDPTDKAGSELPPQKDEVLPDASPSRHQAAAPLNTSKAGGADDDDSKWDSEDGVVSTPRKEPSQQSAGRAAAVVKGGMFAPDDDTDDTDDDIEEEEESTWEKERKEKAALQKQRSLEREAQWEEEYRQRQERHRLEAEEELKKEKEEEERLRKEAEEEEQLKKEQEEKENARKDAEKQKELESLKERERQEAERKRQEEERQRKIQDDKIKEAQKKKETATVFSGNMHPSGGISDDEEEEERSRQIRLRREQAEQELAAAKAKHVNGYHDNHSLPDDDEDTFNDVDVDDLDGPHMKVETMAHTNGGGMVGPPGGYGHHAQEEDVLSYSSTEQEASIHEQLGTSQLGGSGHLNLSFNNDSMNVVRLQEQVREARRLLDKERSTRTSMENKRKNLEKEKSEFITKLEEVTRAKSQLEQNKIDMDGRMRTLQYEVTEETEKRRNAEVLLSKTKEQLSRKEDQYTGEVEAKQKAELSMRNLQMELRTTLSSIKQLEEEKDDLARQMQHEKNARQLQEQINEEQQRLSDSLRATEDAAQPAQAISRLEEADETRKAAMDSVEKLRAELYATKMELDRQKSRFRDDHGLLNSENEELQMKVDDLKSDIKLQEEALAHATMQYNIQLSQLKTENAVLTSSLDKERSAREKLDVEVDSLRSRLSSTSAELEKSQSARSELERNSHKEHEEWSRLLDRRDVELNSLKENNQNLSHRLGAAEAKVSAIENELHIANATLIERTNQLSTIQRELDQRRNNQDNMDESFRKDKEDNVRMSTRIETMSERLTSVQHENLTLKQQLDEARLRDLNRDQGDSSEKLTNMLATLRADHDKARSVLEEKNSMLQEQISHLREEVRSAESRRVAQEQQYQRAQSELTDATKRLSVAEASLEVAHRGKDQVEHERISLRGEVDKLQTRLDDAREKLAEANAKTTHLTERLEQAERHTAVTSQQLMSHSADVTSFAKNKSQLEVEMHRLELENAKLEAALKHETSKVESLQKELTDSTQVRITMEALLTNLKTANAHLDDKLAEAASARTLAHQEAEDSRQLWETEVKGRSKLGLRIAQLEREKQEALGQVDEEKRRTRKAIELKRNTELKLDNELQKASQLQKEVATLKAHLKAAKKRLRELDTSDNRINILNADFNSERREMERTISTTRRQLEDIQNHLSSEIETKEKLEQKTRQLTAELKNLTHMEKTYGKLERAKRKLEEDLASYKSHIGTNYIERSELERIKNELETKSRVELNAKLEEVNNYLEEQALARQRLDSMRDSNESEMRKDFEKTRKDMMDELNRLRGSHHETATSIEAKDFEAKKFRDLYESEVKLRERLADKLQQATEKATKAQIYMDRQFSPNTGLPPNNWMSSSSPTPLVLGKSSPGHGVNDLSLKIRAELNRSIAKHMEKSPHIDISLPPRSYDDINLGASTFNKASTDYLEVLKKNYMLS